jgi:hypothetical protein
VPDWLLTSVRSELAAFGVDAKVEDEGNEGGPVYVLLTVAVVLAPFLNAVLAKAGEDAWLSLKKALVPSLERMDSPWIALELEDSTSRATVKLTLDIPDHAFRELIEIVNHIEDVSAGPRHLEWSQRWGRWVALYLGVARRIPPRPSRAINRTRIPSLRRTSQAGIAAIYDRYGRARSMVVQQRSDILLRRLRGEAVKSISSAMVVSKELVQAIVLDFDTAGPPALRADFDHGIPAKIDEDVAEEITRAAQAEPQSYRLWFRRWTIPRLTEFLVCDGVVEDVGHSDLHRLLLAKDLDIPFK